MKWKLLPLIAISFISDDAFSMHANTPMYEDDLLKLIPRLQGGQECQNYLQAIMEHPIRPSMTLECSDTSPACASYFQWMAEHGIKHIPTIAREAARRYNIQELQRIVEKNWYEYMEMCWSKSEMPHDNDNAIIVHEDNPIASKVPIIIGGIALTAACAYVVIPWLKYKLLRLKAN